MTKKEKVLNLQGKTVRFLCVNETIKKGDLVRSICQDHSDGNGWDTTHQPYNHALWQPVEKVMPYWINKTLEIYSMDLSVMKSYE